MKERVRSLAPILFVATLLMSLLLPNIVMSGASPRIYVDPANNTGDVSEEFSVNIKIADIPTEESLYGWEFHLGFNPSIVNVIHTRYFRSDKYLLTSLSGAEGSIIGSFTGFKLIYQLGMRVWRHESTGTETEITSGTPESIASQSMVGGLSIVKSAPWTCPSNCLQPTDAIKVKIYGRFCQTPAGDLPTPWTFVEEWISNQHPTVATLDGSIWTAYYYVHVYYSTGKTYGKLYFDSATYNSRIEVSGITKGAFLSDAAASQGWSTVSMNELDVVNGLVRMNEYIDPKETPPYLPSVGAVGSGILATIKFFIVGEGVTTLHFDFSELFTVIAGNSVTISHKTESGVFDNRAVILPPHAIFSAPLYGVEAQDVTFDASASNDAADGGWIVSYEWDFNYDGVTFDIEATGKVVAHAFPSRGTYKVALRVTDNNALTDTVSQDMPILVWMEGGTYPDLVQKCAWAQRPKWYESTDGREPEFYARVGNPTNDEYQVYVEFAVVSKDEAKKLGTIRTPIATITGGQILELSEVMDLTDNKWRAFSGCPNPDSYNWLGYYAAYKPIDPFLMRRYTVFASCYYKDSSMSEFAQGYVVKYFHFNVIPVKHNIGIAEITTDPATQVPQGDNMQIYLNVTNWGELDETFDITVIYKGEFASGDIEARTVMLQPGESRIETFTWNTDALPLGTYIIKAIVPVGTYELPSDLVDQQVLTVVYIIQP